MMSASDIEHTLHDTKEQDFSHNPNPTQKSGLQHNAPLNPTPSAVPSSIAPPPAPNGGLKAWSQPVAAHLVIFNCWGYISSFGLFQSYYTSTFNVEPSAISWIGSVQILLIYFVGTFSGRALDAGYFRQVVGAGFALEVIGVFATSWAHEYWQLFLAQGICKGLGDGLVFCPTVALVATYVHFYQLFFCR